MPERPLNATAASLLGFLHDGPRTGWDLVAAAQLTIGDFWSLTQSQVYRELSAMAGAGLVEPGETGPRERKPYRITDAGRAAFAEWARQPPGPELIRFPLLLMVALGRHIPWPELNGYLAQHRALHSERLAGYQARLTELTAGPGDPDPFQLATLDFGLAYERAVLGWFGRLGGTLGDRPGAAGHGSR